MKIVLDTNVLISGIFWKGTPYKILEAWQQNRFSIVASKKILNEYFEVIKRIDTDGIVVDQWSILIIENVVLVEDQEILSLSRDIDDDKFINTAIVGEVDYIVSGDDDLLSIKDESPVTIITPSTFFRKIV